MSNSLIRLVVKLSARVRRSVAVTSRGVNMSGASQQRADSSVSADRAGLPLRVALSDCRGVQGSRGHHLQGSAGGSSVDVDQILRIFCSGKLVIG